VRETPDGERTIRAGPLTIEVIASDRTYVVQLSGELDLSSAPTLEGELSDLLSANPESLIVDLGSLEFIDSIGLRCLLNATERAAATGTSMQFLAPGGQAGSILELTGLRHKLPFID
jgi:anti-sigma B factor antagonist